ncbi:MAG: phospholipid carrier-dependent glycosyltransferase [Proteobacteria bacterium]|nr:phospholipid carrier-dependent glycosyltransferase [Pseudomonadota bacterium]
MHSQKQQVFLLLLFFVVIYILPLGVRDLIVPDETRYAEIPREMIAGGDWAVPHLNGLRYFEKPAMGYWVYACSLLIFGDNDFAVRLPSALSVGLSAVLIYLLMSRYGPVKDSEYKHVAFLSVVIYLTCFEVFGVGNTAVLDNVFSLFLSAAIGLFYGATETVSGSMREKKFLLMSGVACGLAFLTKGFLAFVVPFIVLVPYLVWQRRYRDLFRMGWLPILTAVMVSLPWSLWVHLREPDFWRFFFWNEHIRRFMGDNAQHKESFWFFLLTSPGMFIPWTFMVPAAATGLWGKIRDTEPHSRLMRLSLCWFVLPFLFFSCCNGKLLTYILPCFPPFAILMARGLFNGLGKKRRQPCFQWGAMGNVFLFSVILIAFVFVQLLNYNGLRPYHQPWKSLMVVNGLIFMILFMYGSFSSEDKIRKILYLGLSPCLFFLTVHFMIPEMTIETETPGVLLAQQRDRLSPDTVILSDEDSIRAVCWYFKRSDVYIVGKSGELGYGFSYNDSAGRQLDIPSAVRMITSHPGKAVLVARSKHIKKWQAQLPEPVRREDSGENGYAFFQF